jgi:hypothetical protein
MTLIHSMAALVLLDTNSDANVNGLCLECALLVVSEQVHWSIIQINNETCLQCSGDLIDGMLIGIEEEAWYSHQPPSRMIQCTMQA